MTAYYRAYMEPSIEFSYKNLLDYTIHIHEFEVLSTTPCGVWIRYWAEKGKKFINNNNKKRFAYPTVGEAREALGYRLRAYEKILSGKLESVRAELDAYNKIVGRIKL